MYRNISLKISYVQLCFYYVHIHKVNKRLVLMTVYNIKNANKFNKGKINDLKKSYIKLSCIFFLSNLTLSINRYHSQIPVLKFMWYVHTHYVYLVW